MTREQRFVSGQERSRSLRFEQILRNGSLNFITFPVCEVCSLCRVHFQMRSFEFSILFGEDDGSSETSFFFKILFVDGSFCKVGFDVVELAEMSTTGAIRAQTSFPAMIIEVDLSEFGHGFVERSVVGLVGFGYNLVAAAGVEILNSWVALLVKVSAVVEGGFQLRQSSDSGAEFLLEGGLRVGVTARCLGSWTDDTCSHTMTLNT